MRRVASNFKLKQELFLREKKAQHSAVSKLSKKDAQASNKDNIVNDSITKKIERYDEVYNHPDFGRRQEILDNLITLIDLEKNEIINSKHYTNKIEYLTELEKIKEKYRKAHELLKDPKTRKLIKQIINSAKRRKK